MQNKYKEAMAEAEREKERYFNPIKRQNTPTRRAQAQPEILPIAGDSDQPPTPPRAQPKPQGRDYLVEVGESFSRDSGIDYNTQSERVKPQIQVNKDKLNRDIWGLHDRGMLGKDIAKQLGCHRNSVTNHLVGYGRLFNGASL